MVYDEYKKINKDLLIIKIFGYSNIKDFLYLSNLCFFYRMVSIVYCNPLTSTMSKYYEQVKSNYSRDIDHLINFKRDGLWIKEKLNNKHRFISSNKIEGTF